MGEAVEVFNQLDTDQSGSITLEELSCRLSDEGFDDDEIMDLFVILDTDGDGVVTQEEFIKGFQEYQDLVDDDIIVCEQVESNVIRGVMNPNAVAQVQAASAEGQEAAEGPTGDSTTNTFVIEEESAPQVAHGATPYCGRPRRSFLTLSLICRMKRLPLLRHRMMRHSLLTRRRVSSTTTPRTRRSSKRMMTRTGSSVGSSHRALFEAG